MANTTKAKGQRAQRFCVGEQISCSITHIVAGKLLIEGLIGIKKSTTAIGSNKSSRGRYFVMGYLDGFSELLLRGLLAPLFAAESLLLRGDLSIFAKVARAEAEELDQFHQDQIH